MPDPATRARYDARFQAVTLMGWVRWVLGVIVAVAVTLMIVHVTTREDEISNCVRESARSNADANNWAQAAQVRRRAGDLSVATEYTSNVVRIRLSIPMPHGWKDNEFARGKSPDDRQHGCEDAYHTLIPFVR